MAIRAKELAEMLGVSQATISLVLNRKAGLSEKTRKELTDKICGMGLQYMFAPPETGDEAGTAAKIQEWEGAAESIGFIIYTRGGELMEQSPFFPLILNGLESTAKQRGYRLLVINVKRKTNMDDQIEYIKAAGCKGYVIFATEMLDDDVNPFLELGVPIVLLDNYYLDRNINSVTVNNEQGTYALVKSLVDKGHRKIGYLGSGVNIVSFSERKECYFRALTKFGITGTERYCFDIGYPEQPACLGMQNVLNSRVELPTAFLTENDLVAYGAMKAMQAAGMRIPQDISIVGFDDRPICMLAEPSITTVRIPRTRFGGEAIELLVNKIDQMANHIESYVKVEVCVELVERESVANIL